MSHNSIIIGIFSSQDLGVDSLGHNKKSFKNIYI